MSERKFNKKDISFPFCVNVTNFSWKDIKCQNTNHRIELFLNPFTFEMVSILCFCILMEQKKNKKKGENMVKYNKQ